MTTTTEASLTDKPLIDQQLQVYLHELSRYSDDIKATEGRFHYPYLDHYWREPDRHPYLIKSAGQIAGFLLARQEMNPMDGSLFMEVAEIYVESGQRGKGLARSAMSEVFARFPGRWQICVLPDNFPAYKFWQALISAHDPDFAEEAASASNNNQIVFRLAV